MAPSARAGLPAPFRWGVCLAAGAVAGLAVGFAVGLVRPRSWPDPVAPAEEREERP